MPQRPAVWNRSRRPHPGPRRLHVVQRALSDTGPKRSWERAWLCIYALGDFYACTTHLADTSRSIALAQCADLLRTIIPAVRERNRAAAPAVIGGDFNLGTAGQANIATCVPAGYVWRG